MKKKFSTAWIASKQPRKQRKYTANAPLHLKKKLLSVNLTKALREKYGKRNIPVKKGDTVKVMRGKFKNKTGKVLEVKIKLLKIMVEGIQVKKQEGSKVNVPLRASNLQITELNLEGGKRIKGLINKVKPKEPAPNGVPFEKGTLERAPSSEGKKVESKSTIKPKENKDGTPKKA